MLQTEDKIKADIAKLHSEINQFRNQEFWVCSFAIALFGATARFLPDKSPVLAFGVIVALGALYLWHYTLVATRGRLTTYLRVTGLSVWEVNYRKFANRLSRPSQGLAAVFTFVSLGFLIPVVSGWKYISDTYTAGTFSITDKTFLAYVVPPIFYLLLVVINSLRDSQDKLARYESEWRGVLASSEWEGGTLSDPASLDQETKA